MPTNTDFANYCAGLLASAGRCVPKRMFGGFGIGTDVELGSDPTAFAKTNVDNLQKSRMRYINALSRIGTTPWRHKLQCF